MLAQFCFLFLNWQFVKGKCNAVIVWKYGNADCREKFDAKFF